MRSNVILIGYMGCGKSTVGKELSQKLKMIFLDTDTWIEEREGCSVSQIFAGKGEPYFRDLETHCLKELLKEKKNQEEVCKKEDTENSTYVLSVGGGLPVREENRILLQKLGTVIYLKAEPDTIYERLKGDTTRPLLRTENPLQKIREMMTSREEKYQDAANEIILVDGKSVEEIVVEVKKVLFC